MSRVDLLWFITWLYDNLAAFALPNLYLGTPLKEKLAGGYPTEMEGSEHFGVGEAPNLGHMWANSHIQRPCRDTWSCVMRMPLTELALTGTQHSFVPSLLSFLGSGVYHSLFSFCRTYIAWNFADKLRYKRL